MEKIINIKTKAKAEFIDITEEVTRAIKESGINDGIAYIFVPHTTAGITINEGADASVKGDILRMLNKLVPYDGDYSHAEGNSPAHIKSTLTGVSLFVIIKEGKLVLGTWQSIFFCEFDGPRHRKAIIKIVKGS
ncbi:MAG TPA: YjbQ family protein [Nitrospirae bacterium]|nr:YjbQ family protein [Nitrospirota bacterium]